MTIVVGDKSEDDDNGRPMSRSTEGLCSYPFVILLKKIFIQHLQIQNFLQLCLQIMVMSPHQIFKPMAAYYDDRQRQLKY